MRKRPAPSHSEPEAAARKTYREGVRGRAARPGMKGTGAVEPSLRELDSAPQ